MFDFHFWNTSKCFGFVLIIASISERLCFRFGIVDLTSFTMDCMAGRSVIACICLFHSYSPRIHQERFVPKILKIVVVCWTAGFVGFLWLLGINTEAEFLDVIGEFSPILI
jgi:hypothetical protein